MKNFWQIVKAEWKKFLKDSGATLVMIIGVIGYSLFYAIPYSTEVVKEAPVGVVDYDNTNLSRIFTRNLNTSDSLKVVFNPVSKQDAEKQFYQNKIKGFIIIPKDFEKDVLRGRQSTVELFADSGYMIIYKALYMGTVQTAMSLGAKI